MAKRSAYHYWFTYNSFARRHQWPYTPHSTTRSLTTHSLGATNGQTRCIPLLVPFRLSCAEPPMATHPAYHLCLLTTLSRGATNGHTPRIPLLVHLLGWFSPSSVNHATTDPPSACTRWQITPGVPSTTHKCHWRYSPRNNWLTFHFCSHQYHSYTPPLAFASHYIFWVGLCHVMPPLAYAMSCLHTPLTFPCDQTRGLKSTRNAVVAVYHIPYGVVYLRSAAWCRGHRPTPRGSHRVIPHDELGCV